MLFNLLKLRRKKKTVSASDFSGFILPLRSVMENMRPESNWVKPYFSFSGINHFVGQQHHHLCSFRLIAIIKVGNLEAYGLLVQGFSQML